MELIISDGCKATKQLMLMVTAQLIAQTVVISSVNAKRDKDTFSELDVMLVEEVAMNLPS